MNEDDNFKKPKSFAAKIAAVFVRNSALSRLLVLAIVVAGIFAYSQMPKLYNPEIDIAAFTISVEYPGATAEEVDNFVTKDLEQIVSDLDGIDKISARSYDGGLALVAVTFEQGVDPEDAKIKLTTKVNENSNLFAKFGLGEPIISNLSIDNLAILTIGFSSEILDQNTIRKLVFDIRDRIRQVESTAKLEITGGQQPALRVELDPDKMNIRKITVAEIQNAIVANNLRAPAGMIRDGSRIISLEVDGTFTTAAELANIFVGAGVKLEDVATVRESFSNEQNFVGVQIGDDLDEAVFLSIGKVRGKNITQVSDDVLTIFEEEIQKAKYAGIEWTIFRDDADQAAEATNELLVNLATSIVVVFLVLIVFLEMRPALNVVLVIPLVIFGAIIVGWLVGETMNKIALFAFILALGLLVDNATVVVESVFRYLNLGKNLKTAIFQTLDEVGIAMFFSTLCASCSFLTITAITGTFGEFAWPIAFFVPVCLFVSLGLAMTVVPYFAFYILKTPKNHDSKKHKRDKMIAILSEKYAAVLRKLLASKKNSFKFLLFIGALFVFAISLFAFDAVERVNLPYSDLRQFSIEIDAPPGADIATTKKIVERVAKLVASDPDVDSQQIFVAESRILDLGGMARGVAARTEPRNATFRVNVGAKDDRDRTSQNILNNCRELVDADEFLRSEIATGATIQFLSDPIGPPFEAAIVLMVKGPDAEMRERIAEKISAEMNSIEGIVDLDTSTDDAIRKISLQIDYEKALQSGIVASSIYSALAAALGPLDIAQFHRAGEVEPAVIELQFAESDRDEITDLDRIFVKSVTGEMVPIVSVVRPVETRNIPTLFRDERQPTTKILAETSERSIVYIARDVNNFLKNDFEFPGGGEYLGKDGMFVFTFRAADDEKYKVEWGGEYRQVQDVTMDAFVAMAIAMCLIFAILVVKFSSFKIPFVVMMTVPLSLIGIFPGMAFLSFAFGIYMSSATLLAIIALIGIIINNAIIFIEYFLILRGRGKNLHDALIETGQTRLRPIMLTTITTVLGTLTIASDATWSGLAWGIVFGLTAAATITIFLLPVMLNLVHGVRIKDLLSD